jgi:hypothetical protein
MSKIRHLNKKFGTIQYYLLRNLIKLNIKCVEMFLVEHFSFNRVRTARGKKDESFNPFIALPVLFWE